MTTFEDFYRETRDGCYRALIVAVADPHEADELLAEAYTRALERWADVREHPAPVSWVMSVALNLHRDRWRRTRRTLRLVRRPTDLPPPEPPIDPRLIESIAALSPQQRSVVALRVMLDLDTETTARTLGIAPGTVTTHLHRGLQTLRTRLHDYEVHQ